MKSKIFENKKVWLTTEEAAEYLGATPGAIRLRAHRGQFKPSKPFGGRLYFRQDELDSIIESGRKGVKGDKN